MDKYGRRRGPGPVSRSIVEQSLKAWQYYRLRESSRNLYGLQTITWRHDNLEFVNKSSDVLRNQTVLNLIEGFSKREHRDRQLRCVDTCTGKRHLTGHEQMLEARWSFEKGTDESIRTHNVITLARSVAYRVSAIQGLKFRHMDSETTGSVAAGVPEIPAALLRAEDGKGNHVGRQLVTGCLPHSNPLLCSVAFSAASKRGYGCEAVLKWTRSKGRAIVERLGNQWWKDLSIEPSIRDNVLGKRWKRIQSVMDLMGGTQATPQIAKAMDTTRNIRYPDMKLSTWLELTISAHTTISTAQKYQDFIRGACGPERDADWTREAGAVLTLLDTIIGTASDPFQFTTKQGRTKLDAMVNRRRGCRWHQPRCRR